MIGAFQQWSQKLWKMHDDTKKTLLFFLPSSSAAEVEGTGTGSEKLQPEKKQPEEKKSRNLAQKMGLWLGPLLFFYIYFFTSPEGMSKEAVAILASTVWIAVWWITETVPIPVTSLLPIILFPLTGGLTEGVTSSYANDTIFLFLGGFVIAIALEKWNLHRRIALNIISLVGTSTQRIIFGFMAATGFLSMWISNTATAMMMMPIAMSVITHFHESLGMSNEKDSRFGKAVLLGVAYSASIGGLATLIGTPPNTIFAGVAKEMYGIEISFAKWMLFGVPLSVLMMAVAYFYLVKVQFPMKIKEIPGGKGIIQKQKTDLGRMSFEEKTIAVVFVLTALAWIFRTFVIQKFAPDINDTIIAIFAAVLLYLLPAKNAEDKRLLNWNDAKNIPWGILLLFGGGLAIAKGFSESGLAQWIGEQLTVLEGFRFILVIAAVATLVIFLTEITSNTATATMMFPIMASLAFALDVHPFTLMITAGIAASCAFMLPVATPPNAVVFGSGLLRIPDMAKAGFWLNIFGVVIITLAIFFILPVVWGIDIAIFPVSFK